MVWSTNAAIVKYPCLMKVFLFPAPLERGTPRTNMNRKTAWRIRKITSQLSTIQVASILFNCKFSSMLFTSLMLFSNILNLGCQTRIGFLNFFLIFSNSIFWFRENRILECEVDVLKRGHPSQQSKRLAVSSYWTVIGRIRKLSIDPNLKKQSLYFAHKDR